MGRPPQVTKDDWLRPFLRHSPPPFRAMPESKRSLLLMSSLMMKFLFRPTKAGGVLTDDEGDAAECGVGR